ncbi:Fc.00g066540.m01.CDS01 [Cosmosporella sp. VM-42]
MGRNRVLSFMSQFSAGTKTPPLSSSPPSDSPAPRKSTEPFPDHQLDSYRPVTPPSRPDYGTPVDGSPVNSPPPRQRSNSRPLSMVFAHQPPLMDINEDTIPELQPIFTFLNSHSNKLYQEGYFLKLDDQNTPPFFRLVPELTVSRIAEGKPNPDRTWTECFAQLVGTVLSLWDAAELDAAGEDGEVLPKFINLTDASIKMIESLPTRSSDEQPLQNILSISTAGRNRYLLHFNSHHSLIQWTAGIRLAIYEHSTLQEAYTGALIAGKGKSLNNINVIMERSRFKTEEWVRVRFGAGVPWRRCWCVITPPDEKEFAKMQKEMKKRSPYDRSALPTLKGNIKFYDSRKEGKKQKKAQPIASITDAYSAYAIYPQAKSLIDASTLIKIEGNISIHADPPSSAEGFVFVMPEVHPAVSGFEMLLRFLFPTWDTFGLYGRPGRLVASVLDSRSLMFALPKHKRYGYLELLDISNLILEDSSRSWSEQEWRKKLKEATGNRMNVVDDRSSISRSRSGSRKSVRLSFGDGPSGPPKPRVGFSDAPASTRTSRSFSLGGRRTDRTDSAPPDTQRAQPPPPMAGAQVHGRNSSDSNVLAGVPPRNDFGGNGSPYNGSPQRNQGPPRQAFQDRMAQNDYTSSDDERNPSPAPPLRDLDGMRKMQTPEPVSRPPAFNHAPQGRPTSKAYHSPELRRANSRLSNSTLDQLAKAGGLAGPGDAQDAVGSGPSVLPHANSVGTSANDNRSREALSAPNQNPSSSLPPPLNLSKQRSKSPLAGSPYGPPSPYGRGGPNPQSRPGTSEGRRSPMPPGGPPRSPHPQNPNFRPDQNRPPHEFGPGGPQDGRGRPPNQRGPPNGPPGPPLHGPPPHGPYNANYRNGPPRAGGPPGPYGPPMQNAPHRKPLPGRGHEFENQKPANTMSTSSAITTNEIIDHYAFDQGRPPNPPRQGPPNSDRGPPPSQRPTSGGSSNYGDDSSAKSIDYASTNKTTEIPGSVERPRAGVLKTTGGDEPEMARKDFDIPDINFGPTINYGAMQARSQTPNALVPGGGNQPQRPYQPADQRPTPPPHKPQGSPHGRQESEDPKRTMVWQPGHTTAGSGGQGLSAEQYVQQRAVHARTPSGNAMGGMRSTPSPSDLKRNDSYGVLNGRHSRSNSAELLTRPGSRGANSALGFHSSGEVSSHLSAREQEQVARMTGAPLINMSGHQRTDSQGAGLVGAIEAREREKQMVRPGQHTQAVQQAISQRQQQQAAMAYQQQMAQQQMAQQQMAQQMAQQQMAQQQMAQQQAYQQQMMAEQPGYSAMGGGAPQYGGPQGVPPGGYGQPASFSRPLRSGTPGPQQVDPRMAPPQGQYGQTAPGQARGVHPAYQGQAF